MGVASEVKSPPNLSSHNDVMMVKTEELNNCDEHISANSKKISGMWYSEVKQICYFNSHDTMPSVFKMSVNVNEIVQVVSLVDSGANYSAGTEEFINSLTIPVVRNTSKRKIKSVGVVKLSLRIDSLTFKPFESLVLPVNVKPRYPIVLGTDFLEYNKIDVSVPLGKVDHLDDSGVMWEVDIESFPHNVRRKYVYCYAQDRLN